MKFHYFPEKGKPHEFKVDIKEVQRYLYIFPDIEWGSNGLFIKGQPVEFLRNNLACAKYFEALNEEQQAEFSSIVDYMGEKHSDLDSAIESKAPKSLVLVSCVFGLYAVAIANNCKANVPTMSKEDTMKTTKTAKVNTTKTDKLNKKVENIVSRAAATIENIGKRGENGKKATLNQLRALVHYFVAADKLLSNKTAQQNADIVSALRGSIKSIRELLGEGNPALDSFTREHLVSYTRSQEDRMQNVQNEASAWGRATSALTNGTKGKIHYLYTATVVTAHYAWEWTTKTAWPAVKQAAIDVWDWVRNLFTSKPKVEDNPRRGEVIDAVLATA